jgi:hypothetical protein
MSLGDLLEAIARPEAAASDRGAGAPREHAKRRAEDLPPPGCRTGHGMDSLLPYLAVSLASKPNAGPPGGIERRARPRHG